MPQVRTAAGQGRGVELGSEQLLVLAGHALEYATCSLLRASQHQVRACAAAAAAWRMARTGRLHTRACTAAKHGNNSSGSSSRILPAAPWLIGGAAVCLLPPMQMALGGAGRRSLAYKLAPQPGATLDLRAALHAAGQDVPAADNRCAEPGVSRCCCCCPEPAGMAPACRAAPACCPAASSRAWLACPLCRFPPLTYRQLMARLDATHATATPQAQPAAWGADSVAAQWAAPQGGASAVVTPAAGAVGSAAAGGEAGTAGAPAGIICIRVYEPCGRETRIRLKRSTQLRKVAAVLSERAGLEDECPYHFVFAGWWCELEASIEEIGIEDEGTMLAVADLSGYF